MVINAHVKCNLPQCSDSEKTEASHGPQSSYEPVEGIQRSRKGGLEGTEEGIGQIGQHGTLSGADGGHDLNPRHKAVFDIAALELGFLGGYADLVEGRALGAIDGVGADAEDLAFQVSETHCIA